MKKILFFILLSVMLNAYTLQRHYDYSSHTITIQSLFKDTHNITTLFKIPSESTHYKISTKKLVSLLASKGIAIKRPSFSYVAFDKLSPIDTSKLKQQLRTYYTKSLPSLDIHSIKIYPRSYIEALPQTYTFHIGTKNFKQSASTFYIMDERKKRYFFNYTLNATLHVMQSIHQLERSDALTSFNTQKTSIPFSTIRSKPLLHVRNNSYALKHRIKANSVIYMRDVKPQEIVKKGAHVILFITQGDLEIQSSATAITSGALYDMIRVQKKDGTKLKVKVIGVNQVEIQ